MCPEERQGTLRERVWDADGKQALLAQGPEEVLPRQTVGAEAQMRGRPAHRDLRDKDSRLSGWG